MTNKNFYRKMISVFLVMVVILSSWVTVENSTALIDADAMVKGLSPISTVTRYGASQKFKVKASATTKAIDVKWSGVKKSKIKEAQIKVSTSKNMKGAKTYKLSKKKAQKMSYKFTVKSKKIAKRTTYYFQVRVKTGKKWSKWSNKVSSKVKKSSSTSKKTDSNTTEKKKTDDEKKKEDDGVLAKKYKCNHTLAKGETSKIVAAGGLVFDVHSFSVDEDVAFQKIFKVYLKYKASDPDTMKKIDYSKVSFKFDDGNTPGEKWDWLPMDVTGHDGSLVPTNPALGYYYSIPEYKTAMADVYMDSKVYQENFAITEETVPHNYNGQYKISLYYDGKEIASQTRVKRACINNAIKLFKDYGGEGYWDDSKYGMVDVWQLNTFNYYGCQNGTMLENIIERYYGGRRTAAESTPLNIQDRSATSLNNDQSMYCELNMKVSDKYYRETETVYALRYKQLGLAHYDAQHVSSLTYNQELDTWVHNGMTGSINGENKIRMPLLPEGWSKTGDKDPDLYKPIYQ